MASKFYGQKGEDKILWKIYSKTPDYRGYYAEMGAADGIRFSNTYLYYKAGWDGICIEADPNQFKKLVINRPKSICHNVAVGDYNGRTSFYVHDAGLISTVDLEHSIDFRINDGRVSGTKKSEYTKIDVDVMTLEHVLEISNAPHQVDIISIDVEGGEVRVLNGFNFDKYSVRFFIIEYSTNDIKEAAHQILDSNGYKIGLKVKQNFIYCRNDDDVRIIQS